MGFSFTPLFKTLLDRGLTRTELRKAIKASPTTFAKLEKGEYVSLELIDRICNYLDCDMRDVLIHKKG